MSTLHIPGFTAEAALQMPSMRYAGAVTFRTGHQASQVTPQLTLCDKARYFCDIGYNARYWCAFEERYCMPQL